MNKSDCFKLAQMAVIASTDLSAYEKIETIKVLINEENIALYVENKESEKGAE